MSASNAESARAARPIGTRGVDGALVAIVLGLTVGIAPAGSASTDAQCTLDTAILERLNAASVGEMRKFTAMERPYSLASFRFDDADGNPKTIADWSGRTVLVNLWATWCAPCRAEMPSLDALQQQLGSADFEVVLISIDKGAPAKPRRFYRQISIRELGFYHDRDAMTLNELRQEGLAQGLPATLLVNGRGCAIGRLEGPAEWASEDARNLIKAAL